MELLNELASKLGVAVDHLWSVLVRQQYAEGITGVIGAALCMLALIFVIAFAPRWCEYATRRHEELVKDRETKGTGFNGSYDTPSYEEDYWAFMCSALPIISLSVGVIMCILIPIFVVTGIQQLINPEYFALKEILNTIKAQ